MEMIDRALWIIRLLLIRLLGRLATTDDSVCYVGSHETLPAPLTPDEEACLIGRLMDGEDSVRAELVERNLRLVVYIARKFESTGVGVEDLVSIGAIGLIKAVNTSVPVYVEGFVE